MINEDNDQDIPSPKSAMCDTEVREMAGVFRWFLFLSFIDSHV